MREAVEREGLKPAPSVRGGLAFLDPWGNHMEIVDYRDVQFERTPASGASSDQGVEKTDAAHAEIDEKGLR